MACLCNGRLSDPQFSGKWSASTVSQDQGEQLSFSSLKFFIEVLQSFKFLRPNTIHDGYVILISSDLFLHTSQSIYGHKSASPPVSPASANAKSGSTPPNKLKSATPTHVLMSRSSSRTVVLSSSPPLCTPAHGRGTCLLQRERGGIPALVRERVRAMLGCLPRCSGCEDSGFSDGY